MQSITEERNWLGRSGLIEQLTFGFWNVVLTVVNKRSVFSFTEQPIANSYF
jgi:hypothetical protein